LIRTTSSSARRRRRRAVVGLACLLVVVAVSLSRATTTTVATTAKDYDDSYRRDSSSSSSSRAFSGATRMNVGSRRGRYAGNSRALVLRGVDDARGVDVAIKCWCGVRGEYRQREGVEAVASTCDDEETSWMRREPERVVAVHTLIDAMGFGGLTPRVEVVDEATFETPRDALSSGATQRMKALVMDFARGKCLEELTDDATASENPRNIVTRQLYDVLTKIRREDVEAMTLLDFTLENSDRNVYNAFATREGALTLIDNAEVLKSSSLSAVSIPGTDHHWYFIGGYVSAEVTKTGECHGGPASEPPRACVEAAKGYPRTVGAILDYRCWVKGGVIGKKFPPRFATFLREAAAGEHDALAASVADEGADVLRERASLLLDHGFEGALKIVLSRLSRQYAVEPPCCDPLGCDWPASEGVVARDDAGATTGPFARNHENLSDIARALIGPNDAASVERFLEIVHRDDAA
jgi:hypothetical protein